MKIPERYKTPLLALLAAVMAIIGLLTTDLASDDTPTPTTVEPPTTVPETTTTVAPTTTTVPPTTTTSSVPPPTDPPGILPASLPAPRPGHATVLLEPAGSEPFASDIAAFRTTCWTSHYGYNDPIVYPGGARFSHLHTFFGNTSVDHLSNDMRVEGDSTCAGGTANLTGYWVPTMIDTATGTVVDGWSGPWSPAFEAYYKAGYQGVLTEDIVAFPEGLRMIAGDAMRTSEGDPWSQVVRYTCRNGTAESSLSIADCAAGDILTMEVRFPQCWDGVNLDSPDHKSHMAYGLGWPDQGCPASHPVALPEITYQVYYPVTSSTSSWRLSSDTYDGPAGFSGHGDWWNGWDSDVMDEIIANCYGTNRLDCRQNLLGNGQQLTWRPPQ